METGLSDDNTVEITSGLTEGQTVYYKQSTGTEITSDTSSTSTFNMMGGSGGGQMPSGGSGGQAPSGGGSGQMPSGGGPGGNGG